MIVPLTSHHPPILCAPTILLSSVPPSSSYPLCPHHPPVLCAPIILLSSVSPSSSCPLCPHHPPVLCAPIILLSSLPPSSSCPLCPLPPAHTSTRSCRSYRSHKPSLETVDSPEYEREESPSAERLIQSAGDHVTSHVTTAVGHVTTTTATEQGLVTAVQNHVTTRVTTSNNNESSHEITSSGTEQGHVTTRTEQGVQMEPQVEEVEELQDQRRLEDEELDESCEVRALNSLVSSQGHPN